MTPLSAAPQSLPVIAPVAANAAPGEAADPAAAAAEEDGLDFAAVLKAQIGQPAAKDVTGAEILAAQLPAQADGNDDAAAAPAADLPVAPDLSALLPALAAPAAATATPGAAVALPSAGGDAPAAAIAAASPQQPFAQSAPAFQPPQISPGPTTRPDNGAPAPLAMPATAEGDEPARQATQPLPGELRTQTEAEPAMPAAAAEHAAAPALAHAAAPVAHAGRASDAPVVTRIDTPVGSRGWDAEIGQKVVWMVNRMESRAELTLTPPQLGRVDVTISVSGEQTHATFVSASPAAREALEQALPRLREILADAGISLGQASVNAGSTQGGREEAPADRRAAEPGTAAAPSGRPPETPWGRRGNGLIDTFA